MAAAVETLVWLCDQERVGVLLICWISCQLQHAARRLTARALQWVSSPHHMVAQWVY